MIFDDVKDTHPFFYHAASYLETSCFFFKNVLTELKKQPLLDYDYCEDICRKGFIAGGSTTEKYEKNLHSLVLFSLEFLRLQVELTKTHHYKYRTFEEVERFVYNNPGRELTGPWYMMALFFSQIFWVTHNNMNQFFLNKICRNTQKKRGRILEAPCGTGIFLANFLKRNPTWIGTALDMSDTAIDFSRQVFDVFEIKPEHIDILQKDFFKYEPVDKYDLVLCGEFLEHLEHPEDALKKLYGWVRDDGRVFITVAVYASMIDHIFLYHSAQEVRNQIYDAGFKISNEFVQNVFKGGCPEQRDTPINYSAVLVKK